MKGLEQKAKALIGAHFTQQEVSNALMGLAKDGLSATPFGALAEPLLTAFLKPVVDGVVGDVFSSGGNSPTDAQNTDTPATKPGGAPASIPSGGMSFKVSGTITLTPASGGAPVAVQANGTVTTPSATIRTDKSAVAAPTIGTP